jgi:CheY-like chemotaxis protein
MGGTEWRLLVVEDDSDTRLALKELLESRGYRVDTAGDGREALEVLQKSAAPHVILLDLMLPSMSGWELLAEVRKIERLAATPVVVVSALAGTPSHLPSGVVGLAKPADIDRLVELIEKVSPSMHV